MAKPVEPPDSPASNGKTKIHIPSLDRDVSVKKARALMAELTDEAANLREDESSAAKTRRVAIARELRQIQNAIDATEEIVEVVLGPKDSLQWPYRIGPREFYPGVHRVRASIAQTLRYMVDQHKATEERRTIHGGDAWGEEYGKEVRL